MASRKAHVMKVAPGWEAVARAIFDWIVTNVECEVWVDLSGDDGLDAESSGALGLLRERYHRDRERRFRSRPYEYLRVDPSDSEEVNALLTFLPVSREVLVYVANEPERYPDGHAGFSHPGPTLSVDVGVGSLWAEMVRAVAASDGIDLTEWFETLSPWEMAKRDGLFLGRRGRRS